MLELEDARILVGLVGADNQLRVIADDLINLDFDLVAVVLVFDRLRALRRWRHVDCETANIHLTHVSWFEEQSNGRGAKLELLDGDEWLVIVVRVLIALGKNAQAVARDFESVDDADLQVIELDFAVESGAKGFDDATLEDGTGVREDDLNDDDQNDKCEDGRRNPPPPGFRSARTWSFDGLLK